MSGERGESCCQIRQAVRGRGGSHQEAEGRKVERPVRPAQAVQDTQDTQDPASSTRQRSGYTGCQESLTVNVVILQLVKIDPKKWRNSLGNIDS